MVDANNMMPAIDLPVELWIDDDIQAQRLDKYSKSPCKVQLTGFALCVSGQMDVTINLKDYTLTANDLVTILPGSFIQIRHVSSDTRLCFLGFSSQFITHIQFWKKISHFFVLLINCPVIKQPVQRAAIYTDAFSLICRMRDEGDIPMTPIILQSVADFFLQIILEAYRSGNVRKAAASREEEIMGEFIQLAFKNYHSQHQVTFYARSIGLSLSHFCSAISKASGKTAQEIIARLIILDAKAQLKGSALHVNRIALSLGFSTPTTFNRYFRKHVGMTPEQYRMD